MLGTGVIIRQFRRNGLESRCVGWGNAENVVLKGTVFDIMFVSCGHSYFLSPPDQDSLIQNFLGQKEILLERSTLKRHFESSLATPAIEAQRRRHVLFDWRRAGAMVELQKHVCYWFWSPCLHPALKVVLCKRAYLRLRSVAVLSCLTWPCPIRPQTSRRSMSSALGQRMCGKLGWYFCNFWCIKPLVRCLIVWRFGTIIFWWFATSLYWPNLPCT